MDKVWEMYDLKQIWSTYKSPLYCLDRNSLAPSIDEIRNIGSQGIKKKKYLKEEIVTK